MVWYVEGNTDHILVNTCFSIIRSSAKVCVSATSSTSGDYRIPGLIPGRYEVRAEKGARSNSVPFNASRRSRRVSQQLAPVVELLLSDLRLYATTAWLR